MASQKKYYVFGKSGYEDEFVEVFEKKNDLEKWLIRNEDDPNFGGCVSAVVYGEEINFKIQKRSTSITFI